MAAAKICIVTTSKNEHRSWYTFVLSNLAVAAGVQSFFFLLFKIGWEYLPLWRAMRFLCVSWNFIRFHTIHAATPYNIYFCCLINDRLTAILFCFLSMCVCIWSYVVMVAVTVHDVHCVRTLALAFQLNVLLCDSVFPNSRQWMSATFDCDTPTIA